MEKLDFNIEDVNEVYNGPGGVIWEMLMGEEIHVGGAKETDILAQKASLNKNKKILDICSALGGPARHLAKKYGCRVVGLDATWKMHKEAKKRTDQYGLDKRVVFKYGNALDMPFKANKFDVVWGQDAWCYITDKERLIEECYRVLKLGGTIAFTDWIITGDMSQGEQRELFSFMVFPYLENLSGYSNLLNKQGFEIIEEEDISQDFARYMHVYQKKLDDIKDEIIDLFGLKVYKQTAKGLQSWAHAANRGQVGRCRVIGIKRE